MPPLNLENKEELCRRLWNPHVMPDYVPIQAKPQDVLSFSEIRFFKNGKDLGIAFKDLFFGNF